jgi:hypothetical protein
MNEATETQTVVIPKDLHKKLKIEAAKRDLSIGAAAEEAVEAWVKTKPARKDLQPA